MAKGKDYTGSRFGRLLVTKRLNRLNRDRLYECICDCGNKIVCGSSGLTKGTTTSCGCYQKEVAKEILKVNSKVDLFKNTKIGNITSKKPSNVNTSGVIGVSYRKDTNKWRARITLQGREIALGCFDNKEDAIKARKEAEEIYFKPIVDEFILTKNQIKK